MRITFFGTGTGVPGPNKKCSCALMEAGGGLYLIDAGCDPMPELVRRGLRPEDIRAVFLTHRHGDHTFGLAPFVSQCSWHFKEADPLIFLPEQRLLEPLRAWIAAADGILREDLRFAETREGLIYDDGVLRVTAEKTGHLDVSYAYIMECEGKRVLFSGDLSPGDPQRLLRKGPFDAAVCECGHFSAMTYLDALRAYPPKHFYLNHFSKTFAESCHHLRTVLESEVPVTLLEDDYEILL